MIRPNRPLFFALASILCVLSATTTQAKSAKSLDIYFIDVEGGQATLIVSPHGESLLVDTGYPGVNGRDADRIVAATKAAGLRQLDYVLITPDHADHVGGVTQLAERMKIGAFVDHGPNQEDSAGARDQYAAYQKLFENGRHLVIKPGDRLAFKDMKVEALASAGEHI